MAAATLQYPIPDTPRVLSPSPDPSEASLSSKDGYLPPTTRSAARQLTQVKSPPPRIDEDESDPSSGSDPEHRARSRSRSVEASARRRRLSGLVAKDSKTLDPSFEMTTASRGTKSSKKNAELTLPLPNGTANGHLSPASAAKYYWRELSRSPSPLGLIPIHREWRSFIHRHEIPRKVLHVSIGFISLELYRRGFVASQIHPVLLGMLVPIALVDLLRHNWPPFNRLYIRVLGAFMRESEAHEKYNGVIWYLVGAWAVMRFCPKDVAVMSVLLLSWCDTAASTIGRQFGRYTPRIRRGKSLAGSLAAALVGIGTAAAFWGWIVPHFEPLTGQYSEQLAYTGHLSVPTPITDFLGWTSPSDGLITGGLALGLLSLWTGFVASASEAVDIFGLDDNVTIPILCGIGLWGFLKVFSGAF